MALRGRGFVINLDDKGNQGTHWTAARMIGDALYYADPFGSILNGYPPKELSDMARNSIVNAIAFQHPNTKLCGYYARCFVDGLNQLQKGANLDDLHEALMESVEST